MTKTKCENCERLERELAILEGAIAISAEMASALKTLIPNPESLDAEKRQQWQRVVDTVFKASDYADEFNVSAWGGRIIKISSGGVSN